MLHVPFEPALASKSSAQATGPWGKMPDAFPRSVMYLRKPYVDRCIGNSIEESPLEGITALDRRPRPAVSFRVNETATHRFAHRFRPIRDIEFAEKAFQVRLHRVLADPQHVSELAIAQTFAQ